MIRPLRREVVVVMSEDPPDAADTRLHWDANGGQRKRTGAKATA